MKCSAFSVFWKPVIMSCDSILVWKQREKKKLAGIPHKNSKQTNKQKRRIADEDEDAVTPQTRASEQQQQIQRIGLVSK